MKLYTSGSKRYFVNMFADFIVNHLDPHNKKSLIQVTDCVNFLVIGGQTESKDILDLQEIKSSFCEKYEKIFKDIKIPKLNIIDLIIYDNPPKVSECISFGPFYNNERPIYHSSQITSQFIDPITCVEYTDNLKLIHKSYEILNIEGYIKPESLHISSEFPHGYSINNLRNKLYYSEYLSINLFSIQGVSKINFKWTENEVSLDCESFIDSDHIESLMKDVFSFNLEVFNKKIKEYQIMNDILLPFERKPWLKTDKVSELIII